MKFRIAAIVVIAVFSAGCTAYLADRFHGDPYEDPFWEKYLNPAEPLDRRITDILDDIRSKGPNPALQNELGALLVEKGFPKDAEQEFRRAIREDARYYPAFYNLALSRQARGDDAGARRALRRTLQVKPGHAAAHFQLGLSYEEEGLIESALEQYEKAYRINEALLDPSVNPRILDTELVDLALLRIYPSEHVIRSLTFEKQPYFPERTEATEPAPSDVPEPEEIVTPTPPPTDPQ